MHALAPDPLTIVLLWIAAIFLAVEQATKQSEGLKAMSERLLPKILKNPNWRYLPLLLLIAAAGITLYRAIAPIPPHPVATEAPIPSSDPLPTPPPTSASVSKNVNAISWFGVAVNEYGINTSTQNGVARIVDYISTVRSRKGVTDNKGKLDDTIDWSSAFIEWTMNRAGLQGPNSIDAKAWANWGRKIDEPEIGCIVVLLAGPRNAPHVGLYVSGDKQYVKIIAGRQYVTEDELGVGFKTYPRGSVIGFRMPLN